MRKYARPHLLCWYWYVLHFFRNFFLLCSITLQASSAASLFSFFPLFDKHQAKKKVWTLARARSEEHLHLYCSAPSSNTTGVCALCETLRDTVFLQMFCEFCLTCAYDFVRWLCSYNIQNPSGRKSFTVPSWLSSVFWSLIQPRAV